MFIFPQPVSIAALSRVCQTIHWVAGVPPPPSLEIEIPTWEKTFSLGLWGALCIVWVAYFQSPNPWFPRVFMEPACSFLRHYETLLKTNQISADLKAHLKLIAWMNRAIVFVITWTKIKMMTMMTEMEMTMVEICHRWEEKCFVGEEYVDLGSLLFPPPDNRGHTGSTGDYCWQNAW